MSFKEGKKQITGAISVNDQDISSFKELNKKGIELEIRVVASDSKVLLKDKLPL
ncbi:Sorbose-specific phosphotransferase enzyme IIB component [compost metagenome]